MTEALILPTAFLLGLLGGTHCLGMCGGIAATVSLGSPKGSKGFFLLLGYNFGRILSYTLAGALLGSLGWLLNDATLQLGLRSFAGLMLIFMGLYIAQWWRGLTHLERMGGHLWKHISPFASKLLPVQNLGQASLLGALWGWLPCGLVYSTLIWAASASNWQDSALLMAAFGLGTLPTMLLTGVLAQQVKQLLQKRLTQHISGALIIGMGLYSIPWQGIIQH